MDPTLTWILAQTDGTTGTTEPAVERVDPSRPLSDWLIDVFELDPEGSVAGVMSSLVEQLLQIVITVVVAWFTIRLLRRAARRFITEAKAKRPDGSELGRDAGAGGRRNQRLEALSAVLNSIVSAVVWAIALLVVLGTTFGVNIAPFLAGAGIIGIAIDFGAQDLVKDFVSGVFMLVEDQYAVGDVIDVGDATGVGEKISLRTTRLRDVSGTVWHFPNGEIRRVGNLSQEWSRALLDIGIGYGSDIDQASRIIETVAGEMAGEPVYASLFLDAPEVWGVEDMAADSIAIRLVIKTVPGEQWAIGRELRRRIKLAFDEAGIEIPFPQRTVWLKHEDGAEESDRQAATTDEVASEGKGAPEEGALDEGED
jgi:small conductance mechanosensitive channel